MSSGPSRSCCPTARPAGSSWRARRASGRRGWRSRRRASRQSSGCAVEWVRATRSAASIPLGAFAALLPTGPGAGGGAELLAHAREALAERAGGRRLVLCVDDGHLLDDASAALVHQLVAAGEAFALTTVRRGEPAPDALRALWKDELCALVELGELSRAEVERLLGEALGGAGRRRSRHRVVGADAGQRAVPARARALRRRARRAGRGGRDLALARRGRRGDAAGGAGRRPPGGARAGRAGRARGRCRRRAAGDRPARRRRDRRRSRRSSAHDVVEVRVDGRRRSVDVAHPLHGEVVRTRLSRTRQEAIQRRLADAVEARGARRRTDVPRLAVWRLESGAAGDHALLERAAEQALSAVDHVLAERFALRRGAGGRRIPRAARARPGGRRRGSRGRGGRAAARAGGGGGRRRRARGGGDRDARGTCSGGSTGPPTPTPCCAAPSRPSRTARCATRSPGSGSG